MLKVQKFQTLTGTEFMMAEIACMHDKAYEKKQWDERIAHFHELDFTNKNTIKKASNPIGLRAAVEAYKKAMNGEASGYLMSLDASSSGLQLLSLLVNCPTSWKLCGGDESILDAYAAIYVAMGVAKTLDRKAVKQSIMTALYGSTATPEAVFGENIDIFYETLEVMAPGAWDLNLGIQDLWEALDGTTYDWTLPDNFYACIETSDKEIVKFNFLDKDFEVIQKVNARPRFHKGLGPNLIHSIDGMIVREMYRRCQFDPTVTKRVIDLIIAGENGTDGKSAEMVKHLWNLYKESGFLSVRILDYLHHDTIGLVDALVIAKMIQTLPEKSFQLVCVHDCFRCHPNYGNDLRIQYNTIMADIAESNILPFIASQVIGRNVKAKKVGHIPREVILNGNYLLS
ncbi:RNA polymerase [Sulfitobacter phage phiCB2047-B]|uniref:Uncharacterized protein n=1 Tax=Sulfitobacter phage phiCB2047-B TaxID=754046 RepID=M4PQP6_9CAUD|nr:RNA polymerase [Sulfitobacter phage phiCB2047-B]AGH07425.1 hypothetical protein SUFG_00058 [Sulfitobacter phage phiCB2047-B]